MNESTTELLGTISDRIVSENAVIADLARRAVAPTPVDIIEDRLIGVVVDGKLTTYDLDDYADQPRAATGLVTLTDPDSFVEYVNRHSNPRATTLWSDVKAGRFTAVLDDHGIKDSELESSPGYGSHRAVLALRFSPDWLHWAGERDNKLMSQQQFAEHIEDGAECVRRPESAAMLELAQSFQATTRVDFESGDRLQSGEVQLTYKETVQARAGNTAHIEIPDKIDLELQVFDGGSVYRVTARFMYRIEDRKLKLGYRLIRPDVAVQSAFDDMAATISTGIELPVMAGTPRPQSQR